MAARCTRRAAELPEVERRRAMALRAAERRRSVELPEAEELRAEELRAAELRAEELRAAELRAEELRVRAWRQVALLHPGTRPKSSGRGPEAQGRRTRSTPARQTDASCPSYPHGASNSWGIT